MLGRVNPLWPGEVERPERSIRCRLRQTGPGNIGRCGCKNPVAGFAHKGCRIGRRPWVKWGSQENRRGGSDEDDPACRLAFAGGVALAGPAAFAQDALKIAVGQINNWENQAPTLGEEAGIFKKHNLKIEAVGTQGAGETIQAVISGSADLGAGVGVAGVMRAFAKGAPVRILLPAFTGTGDIYWYVKGDSPIKTCRTPSPNTPSPIRPAGRPRTTSCLASFRSSASRRNRPRPEVRPRR